MQTIHLKPQDAAISGLARAFPSYAGNKFKMQVHDSGNMELRSYWDGGSRDYYVIVRLSDMQALPVPQNGSGFDPYERGIALPLPSPGYAVVQHSIFCGTDMGLTFHLHADNATPYLPKASELSWAQKVVLVATRSLKSSYAGIKDYRFHEAQRETGISRAEWDAAKQELIASKYLNSAGAITIEGKNAIGSMDLYRLGKAKDTTS